MLSTLNDNRAEASFVQSVLIMFLYHVLATFGTVVFSSMYTPFNRLSTLLTVEGELKRAGVLPPAGYGGIRSACRKQWQAEGLAGCMRSMFITPILRCPVQWVFTLLSLTIDYHLPFSHVFMWGFPVLQLLLCICAPYDVLQKCIRVSYRADIKWAPRRERLPYLRRAKRFIGDALKGSQRHIPYHFDGVVSVAKAIQKNLTFKSYLSLIAADILYVNLFMLSAPGKHPFLVDIAIVAAREVLLHPFRVVLGRMAVNIAMRRENGDEATESKKPYSSVLDCVQTIVRTDGVRGLWAGLRLSLLVALFFSPTTNDWTG